jgi:peptide/nickel transport system permease protein
MVIRANTKLRKTFWFRFVRNRAAAIGLSIILLVITAAVFAPVIAPFDPNSQNIRLRLMPPGFLSEQGVHLFGTDALGRDIFSRLIYGARISLIVGVAAVLLAGTIGVVLGLISGYMRGWIDAVIMRWTDIQLALPFLVLALAVVAALGSGLGKMIVVLGVTGWVYYARIVRAEVLTVRELDYIDAVRALGAPVRQILWRHVLPNVASSIIVMASLQVARMILFESSLSFLGLGIPPEIPTWGNMVADGRNYLSIAWWVSTIPGLAIFVTVLGINLCGDRLRDVLDPKLRARGDA